MFSGAILYKKGNEVLPQHITKIAFYCCGTFKEFLYLLFNWRNIMSYADDIKSKTKTPEQAKADAIKAQNDKRMRCLNSKVDFIMVQVHRAIETAAANGIRKVKCTPYITVTSHRWPDAHYNFSSAPGLVNGNTSPEHIYNYCESGDVGFAYVAASDFTQITELINERLKKDGFVDFNVSFKPEKYFNGYFRLFGLMVIKKPDAICYKLNITVSW